MTTRNRRILGIALLICSLCYIQASKLRWVGEIGFAMDLIHDGHFEKVDRKELYGAAMRGMVKSLDPYSNYIDAEDYTQFQRMMEQHFGGIGIIIDGPPRIDRLTVVMPLYGSPAFKAGLEPGDIIVAIDGKQVDKLDVDDSSRLMKGKEGTNVKVSIEREGVDKNLEFDLVRDIIDVESVLGDRRLADARWSFFLESEPEIAYFHITSFGEKTVDEVTRALKQIGKAKGLIIDLRDNPGGLLTAATDICDMFLDDGEIVSTKGREGRFFSNITAEPGTLISNDIPIAIMLNDQSASASEVVAGCLQDRGRAIVVGQRSFGKGSVQTIVELDGGKAALKLTTARYYPPSGRNIHRDKEAGADAIWGVQPEKEWELELDEEQRKEVFNRWRLRGSGPKASQADLDKAHDPQLDKAIEAIKSKWK